MAVTSCLVWKSRATASNQWLSPSCGILPHHLISRKNGINGGGASVGFAGQERDALEKEQCICMRRHHQEYTEVYIIHLTVIYVLMMLIFSTTFILSLSHVFPCSRLAGRREKWLIRTKVAPHGGLVWKAPIWNNAQRSVTATASDDHLLPERATDLACCATGQPQWLSVKGSI